mmetsp:Transcript_34589/g.45856  ORF Transcript_34589/g.45856 Transcript_34589/m.45856 type:complete len:102 (-) Transcript_34589:2343-2648(-)
MLVLVETFSFVLKCTSRQMSPPSPKGKMIYGTGKCWLSDAFVFFSLCTLYSLSSFFGHGGDEGYTHEDNCGNRVLVFFVLILAYLWALLEVSILENGSKKQ